MVKPMQSNGEEGIFVEETASGNFVFNNTLRRNGCGIGVYSNAVGPMDTTSVWPMSRKATRAMPLPLVDTAMTRVNIQR